MSVKSAIGEYGDPLGERTKHIPEGMKKNTITLVQCSTQTPEDKH